MKKNNSKKTFLKDSGEMEYNPNLIEHKWQKIWEEKGTFSPDLENAEKPFYNLMMFPYPSAEGLHVGNMYAFTGADIYGRFTRMKGFDVFEPIGLDGFGIHSENYALKMGKHPMEMAKTTQANFYRQLRAIGNSYDLTRTLETYDPDYYRWTQWIFIKMFKKGLAVRKKALVNFCPSCKTVLSDEQVIDGKCERCSAVVIKKELEQWFFKITDYADRLLVNIAGLDWSEKVKVAQKNWIGKSEGARIKFKVQSSKFKTKEIEVFTTRPDTLFGTTFLVVAPEHEIVERILDSTPIQSGSKPEEIKEYIDKARKKTEQERTIEDKEKTGIFSGLYAVNPVTVEKIPVWIADYVLASYGTGAVMGVPAHDARDYQFAVKYKLPVKRVIKLTENPKLEIRNPEMGNQEPEAYEGGGILFNSGEWNGWKAPDEIGKVVEWLEKRNLGRREVRYHLRDWLISRQRYWGPPIPMIYCASCAKEGKGWHNSGNSEFGIPFEHAQVKQGSELEKEKNLNSEFSTLNYSAAGWYPVDEEDLPVKLPYIKNYQPLGTGKSPLGNYPEFYNVKCPGCGHDAKRETDVSDTFLDSSWYFLRYPSSKIQNSAAQKANLASREVRVKNQETEIPWNSQVTKKWLPVNMYIGGAEHSVLHLLYSRFVTMFFYDLGLVSFEEPFSRFFAHGLIIREGAKMSKSRGNVIVPDAYIKKYGADTLRCYLMFIGPFSQGGDFYDTGIEGMHRFIKRLWRLFIRNSNNSQNSDLDRLRMMHKTIKRVTDDLEKLAYNTAIAALMEYYNFLSRKKDVSPEEAKTFLKLLAPFAPHMTEELWQKIKKNKGDQGVYGFLPRGSIHLQSWPIYDHGLLEEQEAIIVVQVNGKRRAELRIENSELRIRNLAEKRAQKAAKKYLEGKNIKKTIYIERKIINFVTE